MKRTFRRTALVAVMALAVLPAATGVASAANGTCGTGEFCLWENQDFNGSNDGGIYEWTGDDSDYNNDEWYNTDDGLDNEASSVRNLESCAVRLYQHVSHEGAYTTFQSGDDDGYLNNNNIGDNRASSHRSVC
ncbi:peptidase inhibitor family I36 protein [Allostreptomyces psammosilenae]|uniref:Peptidase inhibitor family I36 n=1 Tax=Allostreptomyces psammosilenae TaxID=1892865 RepID=A0A852ZZA5_9ACTN|nr:peptidase inhibitor family I36 protein [Allostreptomyces psammosilenae]NYI07666.1 hypothetical protein [Allostreptomyces psammosilenae]